MLEDKKTKSYSMKKLKIAMAITSSLVGAFALTNTLLTDSPKESAVSIANLEALTQNDATGVRKCTKADLVCNCYRGNEFKGVSILSVIEYEVTSCVQICEHAQTTSCPNGSSC